MSKTELVQYVTYVEDNYSEIALEFVPYKG